jgi:hypothetical protein
VSRIERLYSKERRSRVRAEWGESKRGGKNHAAEDGGLRWRMPDKNEHYGPRTIRFGIRGNLLGIGESGRVRRERKRRMRKRKGSGVSRSRSQRRGTRPHADGKSIVRSSTLSLYSFFSLLSSFSSALRSMVFLSLPSGSPLRLSKISLTLDCLLRLTPVIMKRSPLLTALRMADCRQS